MRTEIEELVALVECETQLQIVGDIYTVANAISTQAELISALNKQAKTKLETLDA